MYKKINDSNITKWLTRILITHNFIFSIIVKTNNEYFIEGFVLLLLAIWLTWFNKYFISILLMLICLYTLYMYW